MGNGLCLDVPGSSTGTVQIVQYSCNFTPNQLWSFVPAGPTSPSPVYYIKNQNSGKCLDIDHSGTTNGTAVLQYSCTNTTNQRFTLRPWAYGMRLIDFAGMCVDTSTYGGYSATLAVYTCSDWAPANSWSTLSGYCRLCASNYADAWALGRNTAWFGMVANSGPGGNDCTDFASQSMAAGGFGMWYGGSNSSWWFQGNYGYSTSWNGAAPNYASLLNGHATLSQTYGPGNRPNYTSLLQGDMVFDDWNNDGYVDHQGILVGWSTYDYIDQHTTDRYHNIWHLANVNAFDATTAIRAVHVTS